MDPITIAAALGPTVLDLVKNVINKVLPSNGFKPTNIGEWVQVQQIELERFKAMQDSGTDTGIPWVNALIRLQKPAYATLALGVWAYQETFTPTGASENVVQFAQAIGFWLFGSATLFGGKAAISGKDTAVKTVY